MALIQKALFRILWVACGFVILPCVLVAQAFTAWTDWAEKM